MKITSVTAMPEGSVKIRLISGSISKFVEKDGVAELHIGYGAKKNISQRKVTLFLRKIIVTAKQYKLKIIALEWKELRSLATKDISDKKLGEVAAIAFEMANFDFNVYKKEPEGGFESIEDISIVGAPAQAGEGFERGITIAIEVNSCRALANTPGGDMTPRILAECAKSIAKGTKVQVEV
jgi:leucyl aminopeptidase